MIPSPEETHNERTLVLVRHGQSEGNLDNVFTGWSDLPLTDRGRAEARAVGAMLRTDGLRFRTAYASSLVRARTSAQIILAAMDTVLPVDLTSALNERDYGELTGLNKDEARQRWGQDQVQAWRRSYDVAPPGGESLRDTVARVLPFYIHTILPSVMANSPVLVVAHGNSLRSLVLALDAIAVPAIDRLEFATGETLVYRLREDTSVAVRMVRKVTPQFDPVE